MKRRAYLLFLPLIVGLLAATNPLHCDLEHLFPAQEGESPLPEGEEITDEGEAAVEGEISSEGEAAEGETVEGEAPPAEGENEGEGEEGEDAASEGEGETTTTEGESTPPEGEIVLPEGESVAEGEDVVEGEGEGEPPASVACAGDCGYEIVNVYPHDTDAFTQGLVYVDDRLFEGTGLYGHSELREVDLATGAVFRSQPLANTYFGEGVTLFNDRIYQLTWKSRIGFIYDKDSFALEGQFNYATEGWGLTHDGSQLIMSDGSAWLTFLDPLSLESTRRVEVRDADGPITRLNELEWIHDQVWANVWQKDIIVRIDPETGAVQGTLNFAGLLNAQDLANDPDVLNGIAYDKAGDRLFITGKQWPKLFEIRLVP
jgi:glutaminyl-peptide cyclotransferase